MTSTQIKAKSIVSQMQFQKDPLHLEQAKVCALIAVKEILTSIDSNFNGYYTMPEKYQKQCDYWDKVKIEIESI